MKRRGFFGALLGFFGIGASDIIAQQETVIQKNQLLIEQRQADFLKRITAKLESPLPKPKTYWELWHPTIDGKVVSGRWIIKCAWKDRHTALAECCNGFKSMEVRRVEIEQAKDGSACIYLFRDQNPVFKPQRVIVCKWEERLKLAKTLLNTRQYHHVELTKAFDNTAVIEVF